MKLKSIQYIFACFAVALIYFSTTSYSINPPNSAAVNGCSCHGPASTDTEVLYYFNNGSLAYVNGQTYTLIVEVKSNSSLPSAGFIASANIGTFGTAPAGTAKSGTTTKYWKHTTPAAMTNFGSYTKATFTINWTAPTTGSTALVLKVSGLAADLDGSTSGDNPAIGVLEPNTPLAITFTNIEASLVNNVPTCSWQVADQTNCKQYQLQVSQNGTDFKTIQTILPNTTGSYTTIDATTYSSSTVYYRVNAIIQNGTSVLSGSKQVVLTPTNNVQIYPTTLMGNNTLHIKNNAPNSTLHIYNLNGALLQTISCDNNTEFSLANYAKGTYIVVVKNQTKVLLQQKVVIE